MVFKDKSGGKHHSYLLGVKKMTTIGVFDSGVGGLTVARKIMEEIPTSKIIYYGDTLRVPYGGKPVEELIHLADIIANFLIDQGADLIVDACNSTSAVALDFLKEKYKIPVFGVIDAGVRGALGSTKNNKVGLIGTEATVKSKMHAKKIREINSKIQIFAQAAHGFVPFIEKGILDSLALRQLASGYLSPLLQENIDSLILGCTHYPFLEEMIQDIVGDNITLVDPAIETAKEINAHLSLIQKAQVTKDDLKLKDKIKHAYYVSGDANEFTQVARKLLQGYAVEQANCIVVE
jgi:glutamate racemase